MDLCIPAVEQSDTLCKMKLHKMAFLYNTLENGWTIQKKDSMYIFTKNHEGKKEVYSDDYLRRFMEANFTLDTLLRD